MASTGAVHPPFVGQGALSVAIIERLYALTLVGRKGGNSRQSAGKEAQENEEV